jgi:alkylation response protein AidB-like acyl-CoA dehydrogenase
MYDGLEDAVAAPPAPSPSTLAVARPGLPPTAVLERLKSSLPEMQRRARDLDERGAFPGEDVALLRDIGALELFAGGSAGPLELFDGLRMVGRANLSLGRLFEGHINAARLIRRYGDGDQRRRLARALSAGVIFGVWNTQPPPGVTIAGTAQRRVLRGAKSYATGAGHIDYAVVTAGLDDGRRQMVIAPASEPARADLSAWRTRGMRASLSGVYDLTGLPVDEATTLGAPDDYLVEPTFSAGAWRFLAVQLGGVERIVMLVREHLAREGAGQEPLRRARFARAVTAMRTAYLLAREAAVRAEAVGAGDDAIAVVMMARGVVEDAGLEVMETAARCVGTQAFFTDNALDLACRDLALYLRQPAPDAAREHVADAFLQRDGWEDDRLW